jgi:L-lactate permease
VLLYLLAWRRWLPSKAGLAGAITAALVAWLVYQMPAKLVAASFMYGAAFGLLPVGWTVMNTMLLYNLTGHQRAVRHRSSVGRSSVRRCARASGADRLRVRGIPRRGGGRRHAGGHLRGDPGRAGFNPILAAVLCLIANTSPVAYGGLGTPLLVLADVTGLPAETLSVMAGHQLPLLSCIVPIYMVKTMCTWRQTLEVMPVLVVAGGTFAVTQYCFAIAHLLIGVVLFPMTDIGSGIIALAVTALFLQVWQPKNRWHFDQPPTARPPPCPPPCPPLRPPLRPALASLPHDPQHEEAAAVLAGAADTPESRQPLERWQVLRAWLPYLIMSALLVVAGFVREREKSKDAQGVFGPVGVGAVRTNYLLPVPFLHNEVMRPDFAAFRGAEPTADDQRGTESARYNLCWLTAPGTSVFLASVLTVILLRISSQQVWQAVRLTATQMRIMLPTIAFMLGLSYITRFSGMDATMGGGLRRDGWLYPFFAAMLGWLGVFLTGTDAGSNALFGSLQKITASEIYAAGAFADTGLSEKQAQILICTANSTGGVMGKMIDAQSIVVATTATGQIGREADIFWKVLGHSILLGSVIGLMTLVQAYIWPFTGMVPAG